jgi:hypothetical protein
MLVLLVEVLFSFQVPVVISSYNNSWEVGTIVVTGGRVPGCAVENWA